MRSKRISRILYEVKMKQTKTARQQWAKTIREFTATQKSQADAAHAIGVKIDRFQSWLYRRHVPDVIVQGEIKARILALKNT